MKKILWLIDIPLNSYSFNLQKDLIKHQANSNLISILQCSHLMGTCFVNPLSSKIICNFCKNNIYQSLSHPNISFIDSERLSLDKQAITLDDLKWGARSTFMTIFKFDLKEINSKKQNKVFENLIDSSKNLYSFLENNIDIKNYDEFWTFNGRINLSQTFITFAKNKNVEFNIVEIMGRDNNVRITKNSSNFDPLYRFNAFKSFILSSKKKLIWHGRQFFIDKLEGKFTNDISYNNKTNHHEILNLSKPNILFLLSSEDETIALGKDWKNFYKNQEDLIVKVKNRFPEKNIYVRFHPSQNNLRSDILNEKMKFLKNENIQIFHPNSKITSYQLILSSDIVLTFGSTISIESVYFKKKTICIGKSLYQYMNIFHSCFSYEELYSLIKDPKKIKNKFYRSIMFGYFTYNYSSIKFKSSYVSQYLKGENILKKNFLIYNYSRLLNLRLEYIRGTFLKYVLKKLKAIFI